ncbi:fatty acid cis/trans isomerase [Zoogloea sp.]|uniref:fatty acid cis/trans isomerase n=1 Tax=Zoogloea sp. TaxID=49181 RepID=UPI0035B318A8
MRFPFHLPIRLSAQCLPLLLAGCTSVIAGHTLDARLGPPDPARFDKAPAPVAPAPDYWNHVRPIVDRRCVSCHACYDAPCQLKLTRFDGLTRGANPDRVYSSTRLTAAAPTRLGFDAASNVEWRQKGFHPILNERAPTPVANREASVLYRILALKQAHPGPSDGPQPDKKFDFSLDRAQSCTRIEAMDGFTRDHPEWGMPFGLPPLSAAEHDTLARWIEAGAPYSPPPPPPAGVQARIAEWETLLNGDSPQARLAARYIYEHWYVGQLHFDIHPEQRFELVRSRTPPGQPIDVIATRRPYDDPGVARVYYRLRGTEETPVAKTYMPLALDPARLARVRKWFFDTPLAVAELPGYDPRTASNPFATFAALPVDSRYRFMLDDAQFTLMGFMKGPVCRGQVALNVITDHFWVLFYAPEHEAAIDIDRLLATTHPNLGLPAGDDSTVGILAWRTYAAAEKRYLKTKTEFLAGRVRTPPRVTDLWSGDGINPTAGLTVFRHFDSASVVRGLVGERPQTAMVLGYPLFERMHYLLVAGFDVFGNVGHQLATRLYMDFLRMEGEENFLTLLPLKDRQKALDLWYRGRPDRIREFADAAAYFPGESGVRYRASDTLGELYKTVAQYLRPVRERRLDLADNGFDAATVAELRKLGGITGRAASLLPEHSILLITQRDGRRRIVSVLRNSAHSNVAELFSEDARRLPDEDTLSVIDGIAGAYPNAFYQLDAAELPRFIRAVEALGSDADLLHLTQRFAIRRTDSRFWVVSDAIHDLWRESTPREAAILDYSRLDNR